MKRISILFLALVVAPHLLAQTFTSISPAQGPICASSFPIQFAGSNITAGTYTVSLTDALNNQVGPIGTPTVDLNAPNGRYVNAIFPLSALAATGAGTASITTPGNVTFNFPFTVTACPGGLGVKVRIFGASTASSGRIWQYVVSVINFGPGVSTATSVQVDGIPAAPGVVMTAPLGAGSAVSPTPPVGEQGFSVNVGTLAVGASADFVFELQPDISSVGTVFPLGAHFTSAYTGSDALPVTVVASKDPNDKSGTTGVGAEHFIRDGTSLNYQVTFENDPGASAPAQRVVVTDQLDPTKVDLSSFQFGAITFGPELIPSQSPGVNSFRVTVLYDVNNTPGDTSDDVNVQIDGNLDAAPSSPTYGQVQWVFQTLDQLTGFPPMIPTVGFLPPNDVPPAGQGGVAFSVFPANGQANGTVIPNSADIVFDLNSPLRTGLWKNTIYNPATNHCCDDCVPPYPSGYSYFTSGITNSFVNPFCQGVSNTIAALFPSPADGTKIQKFLVYAQGWETATFDGNNGGWDKPDMTLEPGEGFLYITPSYTTGQIRGCDPNPNCSKPPAPTNGCELVGSMNLVNATWTNLFDGDPVCGTRLTLNPYSTSPTDFDYVNGAWTPSEPMLNPGQSVMVCVLVNTNCGRCTNPPAIQCSSGDLIFTNALDGGFSGNGYYEFFPCGRPVFYDPATVTAGCVSNITCFPPSPAYCPLGVTTISCTASNELGIAHCSFTVTVVDQDPPQVTCPADKIVPSGAPWSFDQPGLIDTCCGSNVTITGYLDTPNGNSITRTWYATDCHGNSASDSQTVTFVNTNNGCVSFFHVNTGADSNGNLLSIGASDQSFTNVASPVGPCPTVVIDPIHYPWVWSQLDGKSQWVGPSVANFGPQGWYTNRWLIILPCTNATMVGQVSADDTGLLFVNGHQVTPPQYFGAGFQTVNHSADFIAGINTIDIVVNQSPYDGTGFRAELEIVTECCSNACLLGVQAPEQITICAGNNGCGTMPDATSKVVVTFSLGGTAGVSQDIPSGSLVCTSTNVDFTITNSCGAVTNVVVPVTLITNPPTLGLTTNRFKVCIGTNGCGVLGDATYLVNANYPGSVTQFPASNTVICVGTNLNFSTNVTFTSTNPCGVVVHTNATAFFGLCCDPPPTNMVLWLTFDETTGATCYNSAGPNSGSRRAGNTIVKAPNSPPVRVTGQYVDNCLCFSNSTYVALASYANLAMGDKSFSIDAWVKWTNSAGTIQVIVMKESTGSIFAAPPPTHLYGYALYLKNGRPTIEMYHGGPLPPTAPDFMVSSTASPLLLNTWTHVAVTVSRGLIAQDQKVTIYVNGVPVPTAGDSLVNWYYNINDPALDVYPTAPIASPFPPPAVTIGAASYLRTNFFKGCLDEIEIFKGVLSSNEVANLYLAKTLGKCRPALGLPTAYICPTNKTVTVTATICNNGSDKRDYLVNFSPVSAADQAGVINWAGPAPAGGYFSFSPKTISVLPGQCYHLSVTITLPSNFKLNSNNKAAYRMTVTDNYTMDKSTYVGVVVANLAGCPSGNGHGGGFRSVALSGSGSTNLIFTIVNPQAVPGTFNAQIVAVDNNLQPDGNFLSLNGLPPGTPVNFSVPLAPNGSTNVAVSVSYADSSVLQPYYVLLLVDDGAGGPLAQEDSVTMINFLKPSEGPPLFIDPTNTQAVISWDAINYGWTLDSSPDLSGSNWAPVPLPVGPLPDGSQGVLIQPTNSVRFFRLRQ